MNELQQNGMCIIRNFLDKAEVSTVAQYMDYRKKQYGNANNDPTSRYAFYADPLIETILVNALPELEKVSGKELYPSYSYARIYVKGDKLKRHVDRSSCEVSLTCNVDIDGEPWSIWCQYPGNAPVECVLHPGDAVLYMGCVVDHWREPLEHANFNSQFMLHYVDKNGPFSSYKWDRRSSLGVPFNS